MSQTYCGACRGERGCKDCRAIGGIVQYTGLTEFLAEDTVQVRSETDAYVPEDGKMTLCHKELFLADVVGRMDAALHGQRERLTNEIREALVKGFLFVLEEGKKRLPEGGMETEEFPVRVALAGNTVMQHLLLGYPLDSMAKAPFEPYKRETEICTFSGLFGDVMRDRELPQMLRQAEVTVFPCLSAFVGGDVVAGAHAVFSGRENGTDILIDLGTNGELLLSVKGRWYGTSAAMGSAFEGGRYAYASELFRKMADALERGIADETGLLCEPYFTEGYEGLLQEDVREFQLAKGALRAGIGLLCDYAGVALSQIDRVYIAGGLGRYCVVLYPYSHISFCTKVVTCWQD